MLTDIDWGFIRLEFKVNTEMRTWILLARRISRNYWLILGLESGEIFSEVVKDFGIQI